MILLQVLDHDEINFPFETTTLFKGLEDLGELIVEPRALKEAYLEEFRRHTQVLRDECHKMHVDYVDREILPRPWM